MSIALEILTYVFILILVSYVLLIGIYSVSWYKIKSWKSEAKVPITKVTIVLPVRNESENINLCLKNLSCQNYPEDLFEIIIVDDSSSDNTVNLIKHFIKNSNENRISLIEHIGNNNFGKKQAITEAIKNAKGELIITTDADCIMNQKWIASIVEYYEVYKPPMIVAPVKFYNEKGLFQNLQSFEFLSLIASGAASVQLGLPIMCNGANLAYEKKVFIKVNGFESSVNHVSGDDVFLMHKIKKVTKRKILFIKCKEAIVETKAQNSLHDFINQRKRWVSKSMAYTDLATILSALIVFILNLFLIASFILAFFISEFKFVFMIIFTSKIIIDFPILYGISSFTGNLKNMFLFLPLQFIYPFYIFVITVVGLFGKFEWKKRKYN